MENTTIAIRKDLKEKINTLGNKGETYSDIIEKLYEIAKNRQIKEILLSEEGTISIDEARKELNKKWPRSK